MSSRIPKDGKSAIERAQELKKAKNLEKPAGMNKVHGFSNSFAALDDENLSYKANAAGISLGASAAAIKNNIDLIRGVETNRLQDFRANYPDMFLPSDISLTMEDILEEDDASSGSDSDYHKDHTSDTYDDEGPVLR
jgi:hypothetical protein